MIQLAIPIEPGNSGGPVIDRDGKVVGIVTSKSLITRNLGFAQVLFRDSRYVDVSIGDLARFVADKLGTYAS